MHVPWRMSTKTAQTPTRVTRDDDICPGCHHRQVLRHSEDTGHPRRCRMPHDGAHDVTQRANALAIRLPARLAMLARLAFNYRWSWMPGGDGLFRALDAERWEQCGENPVRLLQELSSVHLQRLTADPELVERAQALATELEADLTRPYAATP